jgi:hypothetical protein
MNFFGNSLAPGDHAYSTDNFATRIRSVSIEFSGYDTNNLTKTPRVYLIPVGKDRFWGVDGSYNMRSFSVHDQLIPPPFTDIAGSITDPSYIPGFNSLAGSLGGVRRHGKFRAHLEGGLLEDQVPARDSRLVGRSVWNSDWLLVIPGEDLSANPTDGINSFIDANQNIYIIFETYAISGARRRLQATGVGTETTVPSPER